MKDVIDQAQFHIYTFFYLEEAILALVLLLSSETRCKLKSLSSYQNKPKGTESSVLQLPGSPLNRLNYPRPLHTETGIQFCSISSYEVTGSPSHYRFSEQMRRVGSWTSEHEAKPNEKS
jgi:hypothetical protein